MGGLEKAPWRKKREAKRRRRQEERWAAKAGPVTVRKIEDDPPDSTHKHLTLKTILEHSGSCRESSLNLHRKVVILGTGGAFEQPSGAGAFRRHLSHETIRGLTHHLGFQAILEACRADPDLDIQLRGRYIDVYFEGFSVFQVRVPSVECASGGIQLCARSR